MSSNSAAGRETAAEFPPTPMSCLGKGRDSGARREHLERLSQTYWKPVYAFIRRTWGCDREKAQDLAQDFFVRAFENDLLGKFDPSHGNFRSFLKAVLRNFVREDHRRETAAKRGGGLRIVPLGDDPGPDAVPEALPPEEAFDRQWVHEIMGRAVRQLEGELGNQGHGAWFEALRMYDLEDQPATYRQIGERLKVSESEVRNYLHRARVRLREILIACLSEYIGSEDEVIAEMRDLLKI